MTLQQDVEQLIRAHVTAHTDGALTWLDGVTPAAWRIADLLRVASGPLARPSNPATSAAAAARHVTADLGRFRLDTVKGTLLSVIAGSYSGFTAQEAAKRALARKYGTTIHSPSRFDGARRRITDLKQCGYIADSGHVRENDDGGEAVVWYITDAGRRAHTRMVATGWTK